MSEGAGGVWWRRNRWALIAVVPLLVGMVYFSPDDSFQVLRDEHTEEVVRPGGDGWVSYGDARLRLAEFGPAELWDDEGRPFQVPGLTAWQATLTVETGADPNALLGCGLELEDVAGRRYLDAPQALASASDATGSGLYSADCTRPFEEEGQEGPFETVGYFLLPESTEPVALRVTHSTQEPAYVRLDLG
jgi:hypothetical protein